MATCLIGLTQAKGLRASEEGCRQGFDALKSFQKTWGSRIDAESSKLNFCQSMVGDAKSHAPTIPPDCQELQMDKVSPDLQSEVNGMGTGDCAGGCAQLSGSVSLAFSKLEADMFQNFNMKCLKTQAAQSGGSGTAGGTPPGSGSGTGNSGATPMTAGAAR